ncbi:Protein of unknown function DUF4419 [Fusarium oxysporum f. sp. vasinfectum]|uniref:DUF4419 domain-containing protein n=1 Tax=Fusarium oxysporum f. sp. vasinfectum 25433 TaxID=1089449 RepID=X0NNQ8_FUSOX|nr:hypothetical protein FOTG_02680 [Fusarium oxysporum f. sp. vasinfectum 25433]KAK2676963.1 Protein of unknown function DUF4419 [Fusarium oxysporum f. sp. vasinfectum]KAK2939610.1 Protein of unknown function DUF4419 [Fusarium oxysporum f. sp. vasinfectum]
MPVTVAIPNRKVSAWKKPKAENSSKLLLTASSEEAYGCKKIIRSSFSIDGSLKENHVTGSRNGLVWSSFYAYSNHHHLTIRPEDVWFAIVTQLRAYINTNSEKMREYFVSHDDQKKLEVIEIGTLHTANYGRFAQRMTLEIANNIKDPSLREWVLPSFSTTTDNDRIVGSVLLMGALQKYFSYGCSLRCGIPSVTLLGEVSDYDDIFKRLDRLDEMGDEPTHFAKLLRPILRNMILSFTRPSDSAVHTFWNQIADMHCMSGPSKMTGWIIAFCYWDDKGKVQRPSQRSCTLEGLVYPYINTDNIPCGFVTVPVEVDDNGTVYNCKMLAGFLGIQALPGLEGYTPAVEERKNGVEVEQDEKKTGIKPVTGWMIYEFAERKGPSRRRPR